MRTRARGLHVRLKPIAWLLEVHGEEHHFESLSSMDRWLRSNPVRNDDWVTLRRNGRLMYTGPWGGGLPEQPTLM